LLNLNKDNQRPASWIKPRSRPFFCDRWRILWNGSSRTEFL